MSKKKKCDCWYGIKSNGNISIRKKGGHPVYKQMIMSIPIFKDEVYKFKHCPKCGREL